MQIETVTTIDSITKQAEGAAKQAQADFLKLSGLTAQVATNTVSQCTVALLG